MRILSICMPSKLCITTTNSHDLSYSFTADRYFHIIINWVKNNGGTFLPWIREFPCYVVLCCQFWCGDDAQLSNEQLWMTRGSNYTDQWRIFWNIRTELYTIKLVAIFRSLKSTINFNCYTWLKLSVVHVDYQKITTDKASDANLLDAEVAFQCQTRIPRSSLWRGGRQTRTSRSNIRRGGRQTRTSRPLSDADLSQCNAPIPRIRRRYDDVHTRGENTLTSTLSLSTGQGLHIHKSSSRK